jgi:hypothetical protein
MTLAELMGFIGAVVFGTVGGFLGAGSFGLAGGILAGLLGAFGGLAFGVLGVTTVDWLLSLLPGQPQRPRLCPRCGNPMRTQIAKRCYECGQKEYEAKRAAQNHPQESDSAC